MQHRRISEIERTTHKVGKENRKRTQIKTNEPFVYADEGRKKCRTTYQQRRRRRRKSQTAQGKRQQIKLMSKFMWKLTKTLFSFGVTKRPRLSFSSGQIGDTHTHTHLKFQERVERIILTSKTKQNDYDAF